MTPISQGHSPCGVASRSVRTRDRSDGVVRAPSSDELAHSSAKADLKIELIDDFITDLHRQAMFIIQINEELCSKGGAGVWGFLQNVFTPEMSTKWMALLTASSPSSSGVLSGCVWRSAAHKK